MSVSTYSPITTSGQINFTGLGNGTDFNQLISKLVAVEQTRITKLQTWRQTWTDKQDALEELNSALIALKTSLASLDTIGEFLTKTSTTTDSTVLSVTTSSDADEGTHTVTVEQLAQAKTMVTDTGYSSADTDINSSSTDVSFSYVYQGTTYSVDVGTDCTLSELADIINDDPNNAGVKASVVNDGSSYYLQLRGQDTGADATLTIASNSQLIGFSASDFDTVTSNCDALLRVDGWPTGSSYIHRSSNTVSDVIDGLTITLLKKGDTTISTETDTTAVKTNIQTFVNDVNTVRTLIQEMTAVDTSADTSSILTGNYGVQLVSSRLADVIAESGIGFGSSDTYSVLSQLGISTDTDEGSTTEGLLVIDDDTLDDILASNPDAVATLFSADYLASTDTSDFAIGSYLDGLTGYGTFDVSYTTDATGKVVSATINGQDATISIASNGATTLTGTYGTDAQGLVIKCINTTPSSTFSGTASLRQGKVSELIDVLDELSDDNSGALNIIKNNYDDIVDMIDDKIVYEQTRIANYESRLRTKFAKVDSMLSTLSDQQSALDSLISELSDS